MRTNVLVAEDDLSQRPLWESILQRHFCQFKLDWAVNFEEARRLWNESVDNSTPYDLVIADIFLAGPGTGMDLVELKKGVGSEIPFILVTSVCEVDIRKAYPDLAEHASFLSKPFNRFHCDQIFDQMFSIQGRRTSGILGVRL